MSHFIDLAVSFKIFSQLENLWAETTFSFSLLSDLFLLDDGLLPEDIIEGDELNRLAHEI